MEVANPGLFDQGQGPLGSAVETAPKVGGSQTVDLASLEFFSPGGRMIQVPFGLFLPRPPEN